MIKQYFSMFLKCKIVTSIRCNWKSRFQRPWHNFYFNLIHNFDIYLKLLFPDVGKTELINLTNELETSIPWNGKKRTWILLALINMEERARNELGENAPDGRTCLSDNLRPNKVNKKFNFFSFERANLKLLLNLHQEINHQYIL